MFLFHLHFTFLPRSCWAFSGCLWLRLALIDPYPLIKAVTFFTRIGATNGVFVTTHANFFEEAANEARISPLRNNNSASFETVNKDRRSSTTEVTSPMNANKRITDAQQTTLRSPCDVCSKLSLTAFFRCPSSTIEQERERQKERERKKQTQAIEKNVHWPLMPMKDVRGPGEWPRTRLFFVILFPVRSLAIRAWRPNSRTTLLDCCVVAT